MLREYPATSTHSRFGQRGPGRAVPSLSSLPCWVFGGGTPRYGFAVFSYTCPLFLHTSAVVNHAGSVPGVQGQPFRLLAQRMSGSAFGGL